MVINTKEKVLIALLLILSVVSAIYTPYVWGHPYYTNYCHTHYEYWYSYIEYYLGYEITPSDYLDHFIEKYLGRCNL